MKKSFLKIPSLFFLFLILISCDKDFNSLDTDVLGDDNFDLEKYEVQDVTAYSVATGAVQTNNLPINALGIYNNRGFGTTKAHFVTQVELSVENPSFGFNPVIDSVYLYVPYYRTVKSTEASGERIYELDSVYGYSETAKFKLNVLENGYYLREFDPNDNLQSAQKYFSNDKNLIDPFKGTELLNNSSNNSQNSEFFFSNKEIQIYKTNGQGLYVDSQGVVLSNQNDVSLRVVKERRAPGIWLDLKNSFFQQKILNATTSGNLFNNNMFKNYFRGLLFEVEEINAGQGALALLDFSNAEFKILYKAASEEVSVANPNPTRTRREFSLKMGYNASSNLKNNSINLIEHTKSQSYQDGLNASSQTTGDSRLYLKGGNGSVAFIDLFNTNELQTLRQNVATGNWLINDANLTFYIDQNYISPLADVALPESQKIMEPKRIYIFDATNNKPIIDYTIDASTSFNPKNSKALFGGLIQVETTGDNKGRGVKYTIRLTEYVKRVLKLNGDGTYLDPIKIGISVTESINIASTGALQNPISVNGLQVSSIPLASILNPLGTVLYGNVVTNPADQDKKLKLNIYFTKPNN